MLFSRYVFSYDMEDGVIALYHSLFVITVFLNKEEIEVIKNSSFSDKKLKENYRFLYENCFVVSEPSDDDSIYNTFCSLIPKNHVSNVYIITTLNCNYNCSYCFISQSREREQKQIMSEDIADKTISFLNETFNRDPISEKRIITFYGGEPLLNLRIIKYYVESIEALIANGVWIHPIQFGVITNGSLLDENTISYLKSHNISLGVSFDLLPKAHSNRTTISGNDTYSIVENSLELCKRNNIQFTLSITITEDLLQEQKSAIDKIISIKPSYVSLNMLIPNSSNIEMSYYERATKFIIRAYRELQKYGIPEDRTMRKVKAFVNHTAYLYDCCASGAGQLVINPNGEIGICHAYLNSGRYFVSNVNDKGLIIENSNLFNKWRERTPLKMQDCNLCECLAICGGGCPYSAEKVEGNIYNLDRRFCIHSKLMLAWMIKELYQNHLVHKQ